MSLYPLNRTRSGEDFSITKKYNDWLRNEKWTKSYRNLIDGLYDTNTLPKDTDGLMWVLLSAATEEIGYKIYSKIQNIAKNVHDVDTCNIKSLVSYSELFDNAERASFLSYDYPNEILDLINIFSINKTTLLNNDSVLLSTKLDEIYDSVNTQLSTVISTLTNGAVSTAATMQYYDGTATSLGYDEATWNEMTELSGSTQKYRIADDTKYLQYIEQSFIDCISANIFKKYRRDEVDVIGGNTYIWEEISAKLDLDNLFLDNNSNDADIAKLKARLDIDIDFPEVKIVNDIEDGLDSILNYSAKEKLVLDAELARRVPPVVENSLQKYAYSRERDVIRYFRFLSNFSPYILSSNFTSYDVDTHENLLELTSDNNSPLIINSTPPVVDTSFIYSAAKYLTNICIKISYFRENLRNLALKYAYSGTNLLIRKLVLDYLNKHVYDQLETWRFNNGISGEFKYLDISSSVDTGVKIIEYWDSSNYYNISSLNNAQYSTIFPNEVVMLSSLNYPYWLDTVAGNQALSDAEILAFYKRLGLKLKLPVANPDTDTEITELYNFLEQIYDSASLSAYKTVKKSSLDSLVACSFSAFTTYTNPYAAQAEVVDANTSPDPNTFFNNWNAIGVLYFNDDYIIPAASSEFYDEITANAELTLISSTVIAGYTTISALRVPESPYIQLVQETTNDIFADLINNFGDSEATRTLVSEYTDTIKTELVDGASAFFEYTFLPQASIVESLPYSLTGAVSKLAVFGENGSGENQTELSGIFRGKLTFIPDTHYSNPASSYVTSSVTFNLALSGTVDNSVYKYDPYIDVYNKYISNKFGKQPAINHPNTIHPSYMLHPYLKRFVTRYFSFSQFTRLIDSIYETDEETIDKVRSRVSPNGSLINSWKYDNREYTAYRTYYEESPNFNVNYREDRKIDVDGPWYYPALTSYLNNPSAFSSSISAGTNTYFSNIGLSNDDLTTIASAYNSIIGTEYDISSLENSVIYKTAVDSYGNTFTLFKDKREFETSGNVWVRLHNHPLSLPAMRIIEDTDHSTISAAFLCAHDLDIDDNYIWCMNGNPISGKVTIGKIYKTGFNIDIQNDDIKQFETFDLSGTGYRYAGSYASIDEDLGVYQLVTVATSGAGNFCGLPYDSTASSYILPVKYMVYNIGYGDYTYTTTYNVKFDELSGLTENGNVKNIYRVNHNAENSEVYIAFESAKPAVDTTDWYNSFGLKPSANYEDLYNDFDNKVVLPDNSITILIGPEVRSIGPYIYDVELRATKYLYPFSDVTYHGIFASDPPSGIASLAFKYCASQTNDYISETGAQLFSNTFPCSDPDQRAYFRLSENNSSAPVFSLYTSVSSLTNIITIAPIVNNSTSISFATAGENGFIFVPDEQLSAIIPNELVFYKYWAQFNGRNSIIMQGTSDGGGDLGLIFTENSLYSSVTTVILTELNELILIESNGE